ncbi:hypothetical protein BKA93DRAFT_831118 [Sparassis latifolia]
MSSSSLKRVLETGERDAEYCRGKDRDDDDNIDDGWSTRSVPSCSFKVSRTNGDMLDMATSSPELLTSQQKLSFPHRAPVRSLFLTIALVVSTRDAYVSFLLVLAILGTALPPAPGFFLIRRVPTPSSEFTHNVERTITEKGEDVATACVGSSTVFLHDRTTVTLGSSRRTLTTLSHTDEKDDVQKLLLAEGSYLH